MAKDERNTRFPSAPGTVYECLPSAMGAGSSRLLESRCNLDRCHGVGDRVMQGSSSASCSGAATQAVHCQTLSDGVNDGPVAAVRAAVLAFQLVL